MRAPPPPLLQRMPAIAFSVEGDADGIEGSVMGSEGAWPLALPLAEAFANSARCTVLSAQWVPHETAQRLPLQRSLDVDRRHVGPQTHRHRATALSKCKSVTTHNIYVMGDAYSVGARRQKKEHNNRPAAGRSHQLTLYTLPLN